MGNSNHRYRNIDKSEDKLPLLEPMMVYGQIVYGVRLGDSKIGISLLGSGIMLT